MVFDLPLHRIQHPVGQAACVLRSELKRERNYVIRRTGFRPAAFPCASWRGLLVKVGGASVTEDYQIHRDIALFQFVGKVLKSPTKLVV
jgi:hypothetical protein